MKSLSEECDKVILFPPGSYYTPETGLVRWYQPPWWDPSVVPTAAPDLVRLRYVTTFARSPAQWLQGVL